ncbi:MAG: hypothetical protein VX938_04360, partial [Myxococcota bacterium]|nr:hypothetical protein [Myxococcota bacterium]
LPDPTFLREAYPLAAPGPVSRDLHWGAALLSYPQGPFLLVRTLSGVLPAHGYDAWFGLNLLLGTLSIPAAFAAGTSLVRDRNAGLVAACLLAFWPQHIRFVASESAHVHLVFWALVSVTFTVRAARDGRLISFVAAAGSAAALCLTRPEAALWGPALLLLGLGGDGAILASLRCWRSGLHRAALLAGILWLLLPQLAVTASDATPLGPTGTGTEALDLDSLAIGLKALFVPTELNAFFDPGTSPLWLWPLCWIGAFHLWRQGHRWSAAGLVASVLSYVLLYAKMLPAVSLWALGRYHLAALPAVALLAALGWVSIAGRIQWFSGHGWRVVASSAALGALGCGLWWPAISAFPFAWQEEQNWLVELSRAEPPVLDGRTRLVTPDNRRRFGDLSPREAILGLSGTERLTSEVITVAHALRDLHVTEEHPPALFYAGLYCGMGVGPGETINPQCAAMEAAFELEVVAERPVTGPPWILIYQDTPHPDRLVLYRVGKRRLSPEEGLALLPPALELGETVPGSDVLGTSPRADTEPPDPPL